MSSELRNAVEVATDCYEQEFFGIEAAAAVIEADREAVRAEQAAEIERQRLAAADRIEELEADNALLREALEDFVACVGVSDDPDILMVDACAYENATRVLGVRG